MNDPFDDKPHPLARQAADVVRHHLQEHPEWTDEVAAGKMFGVLVCEDAQGQLGFLAAYSGQIGGREDWPWFVPAVFDYLQPDGHFKQEEQRITAINHRILSLQNQPDYLNIQAQVERLRHEAAAQVDAYKQMMAEAKQRRDEQRAAGTASDNLIRESQYQKAQLRRLKKQWSDQVAQAEVLRRPMDDQITALKQERHQRSDALQRWLFDHFQMLNYQGHRRSLSDIFSQTPQHVPPSGAGECCAPKLLHYAYAHHLRPLNIAEFWQGRSPRMEIRHHDQYYAACRGKCRPILQWMLPAEVPSDVSALVPLLPIIYHDEALVVVNKPAGLLSVPGLTDAPSVQSLLQQQFPEVHMVHRLDRDTSGLLVVALTTDAYHRLQQQFLQRTMHKEYVALLEHPVTASGRITLPLRPDPLDRPRQVVDTEHGKSALTTYESLGGQRIRLIPHTGRTHQLRVHCAHADGLNNPILGDPLYGHAASRMHLHAAMLVFCHPVTGQQLTFTVPVPF